MSTPWYRSNPEPCLYEFSENEYTLVLVKPSVLFVWVQWKWVHPGTGQTQSLVCMSLVKMSTPLYWSNPVSCLCEFNENEYTLVPVKTSVLFVWVQWKWVHPGTGQIQCPVCVSSVKISTPWYRSKPVSCLCGFSENEYTLVPVKPSVLFVWVQWKWVHPGTGQIQCRVCMGSVKMSTPWYRSNTVSCLCGFSENEYTLVLVKTSVLFIWVQWKWVHPGTGQTQSCVCVSSVKMSKTLTGNTN